MKEIKIEESWKKILGSYFESPEFRNLIDFVKIEYRSKTIFPRPENIFRAFDLCPWNSVKVVILGQDPYHGLGQAHGLCFSVPEGVNPPPSLKNIYKEIENEFGIKKDFGNGDLSGWASQGVFLLNSVLTVLAKSPASHKRHGWEEFTDYVISKLSEKKIGLVFMLWGNFARSKRSLINQNKHLILESAHPSPFSAHKGFFGNGHFQLCNKYLIQGGQGGILW